ESRGRSSEKSYSPCRLRSCQRTMESCWNAVRSAFRRSPRNALSLRGTQWRAAGTWSPRAGLLKGSRYQPCPAELYVPLLGFTPYCDIGMKMRDLCGGRGGFFDPLSGKSSRVRIDFRGHRFPSSRRLPCPCDREVTRPRNRSTWAREG